MCYSVIRFKRRNVDVAEIGANSTSSIERGEPEVQYAGVIDYTHETAYVTKLRADALVTEFEIYRFHDGEKRVERWEKTNTQPTVELQA